MYSGSIASHNPVYPRGWYALYTKHQHEKVVARNLSCKGFEVFLPLYTAARNWKDRVKLISLPLFPCYVFLHGDIERRLDILTTPGIHDLVSNAGQPAVIPAAEIEGIRQAVGSGARMEPHPFLECGEWVRVKCGPLAGLGGILVRKKNVCRLVVSIEMLGKAAAVEIDTVLIERLIARPSASDSNLRAGTPPSSEAGRQLVAKSNLAVA
jgi:transcription antitermination factor NusG